jgi:hypothetical protein
LPAGGLGIPDLAQALRLLKAFIAIDDPDRRALLLGYAIHLAADIDQDRTEPSSPQD